METRKHTHSLSFLHAIECSKLPCAMFPPSGNKAATRQQKGVGGASPPPEPKKKADCHLGPSLRDLARFADARLFHRDKARQIPPQRFDDTAHHSCFVLRTGQMTNTDKGLNNGSGLLLLLALLILLGIILRPDVLWSALFVLL